MQSPSNLELMLVITAFVAVRLLQLREAMQASRSDDEHAHDPTTLSGGKWRLLWASTERSAPPNRPPSSAWVYRAMVRLGGFADTKRTGRASWATLWDGWFRLQERLEGYRLGNSKLRRCDQETELDPGANGVNFARMLRYVANQVKDCSNWFW